MATRKRTPGSGTKARPGPPSLREQLRGLPPMQDATSKDATASRAARGSHPEKTDHGVLPVPEGPSFKELAADVRPLPEPAKPVLPRAPAAPPTRAVAPKTRLWVERREGAVWAVAEGVPPRMLDELRAGKVMPRRELDLHRRSAAEARLLLDDAVPRARRDGVVCLLVVCGRGLHSGAEGPVLPDVVLERLSEELGDEILAFCTAPRKWGGEGALLVRLRAPPFADG
jgi:DNA-nicking Smr family endonuclease